MSPAPDGFVARERELAQLDELLTGALAGQLAVGFVAGEAGAGKTALVTEFARRAQGAHDELIFAIGDCNAHTGIGDPYLPFREILAQLTGDVDAKLAEGVITEENGRRLQSFLRSSGRAVVEYGPGLFEIFVPGSELLARIGARMARRFGWAKQLEEMLNHAKKSGATPAEGLDQHHLFEQYANVLKSMAEERPLLLVLDDLQWVDPASASLLFHLCRRLGKTRLLILGTYRPADVSGSDGRHPLAPVLNEIKRLLGEVCVDLDRAGELEARSVVEALIDRDPNRLDDEFRRRLHQHTQGNPLFAIELLRSLRARGDLVPDDEGCWVTARDVDWDVLPARVEGVIAERIDRLGEEERGMLSAAAVEGEDFTGEVVARVQRLDERETVRRLSGDLHKRHHLVGAAGVRRVGRQRLSMYQFSHNLIRTYLYNVLDEAELSYLHEDVAIVLEELYGAYASEIAAQLADHFAAADLNEKACAYYLQAAERERQIYANEEAAEHFQRGLNLLERITSAESADDRQLPRRLHEGLGEVLALTGRHAEARAEYAKAIDFIYNADVVTKGRLHRKIGDSWQGQHQGDQALESFDDAESALGERAAERPLEWWAEWIEVQLARAWVLYFASRDAQLGALAEDVRPIMESRGSPIQRAKFLQRLDLARFRRERYALSDETLATCRATLKASEEAGNLAVLCDGRFGLGFAHLWRAELREAEQYLTAARQLAQSIGSTFQLILCLTYLAVLHRFRGQPGLATPYISESLEAARAADIKTYIAAAQANQAWLAWRNGEAEKAERDAVEALQLWEAGPVAYPFQWLALWPLLAMCTAQDRFPEAIDHASALLEPTQQILPDPEVEALLAVQEAWSRNDPDSVRAYLERAIEAARQAGHL